MSDTPMTDDDFSGLVEECNSPAAKRIEQLERELAEALSIIDQIRKDVIADESFGQFIQTLFLDPLDAKERELAEVQELLCQTSAEREHNGRMANECRMQRDRLAEALQPFIDGWSDKSCDSIVTEQQFRDAKQALAAVKGGMP